MHFISPKQAAKKLSHSLRSRRSKKNEEKRQSEPLNLGCIPEDELASTTSSLSPSSNCGSRNLISEPFISSIQEDARVDRKNLRERLTKDDSWLCLSYDPNAR